MITATRCYRNFFNKSDGVGNRMALLIQVGKYFQAACTMQNHAEENNTNQGFPCHAAR